MTTTCPPSYAAKLEAMVADCAKTAEVITVSPAVDAYHRYGQRPYQGPCPDTGVAALEPHISRELLHEVDTKVGEAICQYEAEAFLTGYAAGVAAARGGR